VKSHGVHAMTETAGVRMNERSRLPSTWRSCLIPRKDTIRAWLTAPWVFRLFNAILRQWAPVLELGKLVIVSRHADVVDGLAHDTEFTIAEINAERTNRDNGPFVLSMDRSPQHDREKDLLNEVMYRQDLERIRAIVSTRAEECVERARQQGWLDVVGGLTRVVPLRVVGEYFGVPGPDDAVMLRWMRTLFNDLFLNPFDCPRVVREAKESFEQLRPYLLGWIARRRDEIVSGRQDVPDDVLTRMLRRQRDPGMEWLDDDAVRRNISGLIIGAIDTTSASAVRAIDELLRRPAAWATAREAALAGDEATVSRYVFEALRFNPHNPFVTRYSQEGAIVGRDTPRERRLSKGKIVIFGTLSGMFDRAVFQDPAQFRTDRSPAQYLHFSSGLHACQGRYINGVQIPLLVAAVLRLGKVSRACGWDGRIAWDGPFPDRLLLTVAD